VAWNRPEADDSLATRLSPSQPIQGEAESPSNHPEHDQNPSLQRSEKHRQFSTNNQSNPPHTNMKVVHDDEVFDGQILRLLGSMYEGGVDYGEVHSTSLRIKPHDIESWHTEWIATAQRLEKIGQTALDAKRKITAHEAFLRASQYYRASGQFFIGYPNENRTLVAYQQCEACFTQAMKLSLAVKFETIKIAWKNGVSFPGYFIEPLNIVPEKRGHTLIINGGYDSVKEECYFFSGAAALRRGYNVLLFDGPGQGLTLLEQNVVTMPDWENVMSYLIDYLYTRSEVDKSKIAVMGVSLGGYQVPRAATVEKRINAIIADPGQINIGKKARGRLLLPQRWQKTFPRDVPWLVTFLIRMILNRKWLIFRMDGHSDGIFTFMDLTRWSICSLNGTSIVMIPRG